MSYIPNCITGQLTRHRSIGRWEQSEHTLARSDQAAVCASVHFCGFGMVREVKTWLARTKGKVGHIGSSSWPIKSRND